MHADVSCPRCLRKLRVPEGFAGQSVRCPSCDTTFVADVQTVPELPAGPTAPPPSETFSPEPRPLPQPPTRRAEPDPDQADAARRAGAFVGGWPVVRSGLGWIMVSKSIELAAQGFDLLMLGVLMANWMPQAGGFRGSPFSPMFQWVQGGSCLRSLALVVAGVCLLVGLARCARYPAPGPARGVVIAAIVFFCFSCLFQVICSVVRVHIFQYSVLTHGGYWIYLAILAVRWVAEALLIRFLYLLGRDWRHEPTLARVRWLLALLVADMVLHLTQLLGLFENVALSQRAVALDPFLFRILATFVQVAVASAMAVQALRVLHAARIALAGETSRPD